MKIDRAALAEAVEDVSRRPGIRGCAVVDASAGMIWTAHGELAPNQSLWEAAVDHWRLHLRNQAHFDCLGRFGAVATYHADGVLALFRCSSEPELLFVAVGRHREVDWPTLQKLGLGIGRLLSPEAR